MKSNILNMLRSSPKTISGQQLSRELGVSRVAVWKHIKALTEMGYPIVSSHEGYHLAGETDFLYPWEFPSREDRIHFFQEIPSTMDNARDLARDDCPDNTVVVAQRQTAGRGRIQRSWHSEDGGLYFTMVTRPALPVPMAFSVLFAASVALAGVIREMHGIPAEVKWPNDILVEGKKLAGMLSEMLAEGDAVVYVNLGIGVNVNNDPRPAEPGATSIAALLGKNASRRDLLNNFLDAFLEISRMETPQILARWRKLSATLGKTVRILIPGGDLEGTARDVDKSGALLVETPDGKTERITYGDCIHARISHTKPQANEQP